MSVFNIPNNMIIQGISLFENNNVMLILDKNNNPVSAKEYSNIHVNFKGSDNIIIIRPPKHIKNLYIEVLNKDRIFIDEDFTTISKTIISLKSSESTVIIGKRALFVDVDIQMFDIPGRMIRIGDDALFGAFVSIKNNDGHTILDLNTKKILNIPNQSIDIGNHVWIGRNVALLKNASIGNDCVVGGYSVVTQKFNEDHVVVAGVPAKIVKRNITWDKRSIERYMATECVHNEV